jgi:hypothetical protein
MSCHCAASLIVPVVYELSGFLMDLNISTNLPRVGN